MIKALRRVSNGTIPTATHVCSFYKLSATASRRRMCDMADDNSSDDDAASDVDRGEVQQSDTPSTSAVTDTAVSAPVDNCDVCLVAPMDLRIALVPCGHHRFCGPCAEEVHNRGLCCPMCRSPIQML